MFSYHSCGNRSCPKCHTAQTQEWLEHRQAEMLPVPYFHITVTVPPNYARCCVPTSVMAMAC
jgi:Transposase zinc-binding domain